MGERTLIIGFGLKEDPKKITYLESPARRECDGCKEIFYAHAGEQYFCSDKCKWQASISLLPEEPGKTTMQFGGVLTPVVRSKAQLYEFNYPTIGRGIKTLRHREVDVKNESGEVVGKEIKVEIAYHSRYVAKPGASARAKKSLIRKAKKGGGKKRGMKGGKQKRRSRGK